MPGISVILGNFREDGIEKNTLQETLDCLGKVSVDIIKMVKPAKATESKTKNHGVLCLKLQAAGCFFIQYFHQNIFTFLPLVWALKCH